MHSPHPQRIAIIGAGTAGLATAAFLARQNHHITLIERAPALAPVGAGLLLQPSGLAVLDALEARDTLEVLGRRIDQLYGSSVSGRTIMDTRYAHLDAHLHGLGVHRASLCHVLDECLAQVPHQRWMNTEVHELAQRGNEVLLTCVRNGEREQAAFDAVLIANGSASALRPPELVKYDRQYPWGALWAILPITTDFDVPVLQQRYDSSHTMIGLLPSGATPHQPDKPLVSFFWSMPVSKMHAWKTQGADFGEWKQAVISLWPQASSVLAALTTPEQLIPATYRDVIMKRWASGRIGVIGDAAHAMSPQLGQGANMALLDAQALASAMQRNSDWPDIWADYHRQRHAQLRFYQTMSRLLTPIFQSHIPGAGWLRDIGFPLMHRLPWVNRQMAQTVAGLKTGLLAAHRPS